MKNGKIVISVTVRFSFCQGRKRRAVPFPVTPVRVFPTGGGGGGRSGGSGASTGEAGIAGDGGGRDTGEGAGGRRARTECGGRQRRTHRQKKTAAAADADASRRGEAEPTKEVETYDEMKRRGPRKRKVAYLTVDGQRTGAKRDSITAGVATLERVVAQRYNWRDAGLGATRKRRQGGLFRSEEEDARGKRRR